MRYECFCVGNIIRGISRVADNWMSAQLGYLISHISTARVCTKCKCIQLSTCSLICPESFYRSFSVRCLAGTVWTFQLVSSFLVPVHQCLYSPGKSTLISLPAHTHTAYYCTWFSCSAHQAQSVCKSVNIFLFQWCQRKCEYLENKDAERNESWHSVELSCRRQSNQEEYPLALFQPLH